MLRYRTSHPVGRGRRNVKKERNAAFLRCFSLLFKAVSKKSHTKPFQTRNFDQEVECDRARCIENQIVDVARTDHEQELECFNRGDAEYHGRNKKIPFPLTSEQERHKESKGHKQTEVSDEIEQNVIEIDVSVDKPQNIDLVNAAEGNEINKPFDVMRALIAEMDVVENKISVTSEGDVGKGNGQNQIEIKCKKEIEETAKGCRISRSLQTKRAAAVEHNADRE